MDGEHGQTITSLPHCPSRAVTREAFALVLVHVHGVCVWFVHGAWCMCMVCEWMVYVHDVCVWLVCV